MIKYKIDILEELKKKGYTQTRIQKEKLISGQTQQNIKAGKPISLQTINDICIMLKLPISEVIEIIPTNEEKIKFY